MFVSVFIACIVLTALVISGLHSYFFPQFENTINHCLLKSVVNFVTEKVPVATSIQDILLTLQYTMIANNHIF